jgi:hypothetical protein
LFARKLSLVYYALEKDDLAKPFFEITGFPMPRRPSDLSISQTIKVLQQHGFLSDLDAKNRKRLLKKLSHEYDSQDDIEPVRLLREYYCAEDNEQPSNAAIKDGFLAQRWQSPSDRDNVVANFAALVGGKPMFRQIGYSGANEEFAIVEDRNGERKSFLFEIPDDVAALFNEELAEVVDKRRFLGCEQNDDDECDVYVLISVEQYKTLFGGRRPIMMPAMDAAMEKCWASFAGKCSS